MFSEEKDKGNILRNLPSTSHTPSHRHTQCYGSLKISLPCFQIWVVYKYHTSIPLTFFQIPLNTLPSISSIFPRVVFLVENPKVISACLPLFLLCFHTHYLLVRFSFFWSVVLAPTFLSPTYDTWPSCQRPKSRVESLKLRHRCPSPHQILMLAFWRHV